MFHHFDRLVNYTYWWDFHIMLRCKMMYNNIELLYQLGNKYHHCDNCWGYRMFHNEFVRVNFDIVPPWNLADIDSGRNTSHWYNRYMMHHSDKVQIYMDCNVHKTCQQNVEMLDTDMIELLLYLHCWVLQYTYHHYSMSNKSMDSVNHIVHLNNLDSIGNYNLDHH